MNEYKCTDCDIMVSLPDWRYKKRKQPFRCSSCARKDRETYKNNKITDPDKWERIQQSKRDAQIRRHNKTSREDKSTHAKKMRAAVTISGSELRARQQLFIDNAGEEYYQQYCNKRRQSSLHFHANMTDVEREEHFRKIFKNTGRSKACESCLTTLEELVGFQIEREKCISGFFVDGLILGTNIIIEFYGDMFHCNPRKFHNPDQYCSWISRTVQEQWDRDRKRISALLGYGYKVIIIWEQDWTNDKQPQITRILNEKSSYDNIGNVNM